MRSVHRMGIALATVLLAAACGSVARDLYKVGQRARQKRTVADLMSLQNALNQYGRDHGRLPEVSDVAQLRDRLSTRYIAEVPETDGWGRRFQVRCSSTSCQLSSAGRDGVFERHYPLERTSVPTIATEGFDRDLVMQAEAWVQFPMGL